MWVTVGPVGPVGPVLPVAPLQLLLSLNPQQQENFGIFSCSHSIRRLICSRLSFTTSFPPSNIVYVICLILVYKKTLECFFKCLVFFIYNIFYIFFNYVNCIL